MSNEITPSQSALDSLRQVAAGLQGPIGSDPLAWKAPLAWAWHAVGLLAYLRLRPARDSFDAWIAEFLQEGSAELDTDRDAHWEEGQRLSFLELLDLISESDLPSLKPEFYQGWQDRASRCRNLREKVFQVLGQSINNDMRDKLLLLLAAYHRLVRLPAGVTIDPGLIVEAFPTLIDLVEMLIDRNNPAAETLSSATADCRKAFG